MISHHFLLLNQFNPPYLCCWSYHSPVIFLGRRRGGAWAGLATCCARCCRRIGWAKWSCGGLGPYGGFLSHRGTPTSSSHGWPWWHLWWLGDSPLSGCSGKRFMARLDWQQVSERLRLHHTISYYAVPNIGMWLWLATIPIVSKVW